MKKRLVMLFAVCTMILTTMTGCIKVVKIGEEGNYTGETEFSAGDNVAEFWESEALPELTEKAVDIETFLTEAKGDFGSLAEKYGKYSMGTSGELSYTVKGKVVVEEVNTTSKSGYLLVKIPEYEGKEEIRLQIGSIYKGSAVRDSLDFIKFGDYTNQEEYAAVSQSIHHIIQETIIEPVKVEELQGKTIMFTGCFTVKDEAILLITPIALEVE